MTTTEQEKREEAEKTLQKYWSTKLDTGITNKEAYMLLAKVQKTAAAKLYKMEQALKKLGREAGMEVVDVTKTGEIVVVVERHTKNLP